MWKLLVVALLALLAAGCSASRYAVGSWQYVQTERVANGLQPLEWDTALAGSAQVRAQEIAALGRLDHSGAQVAANVFYGDRPSICEIIGSQVTWAEDHAIGYGWVASPAHRDCALGANYRRAAIGVAVGEDGLIYEVMWLTN